MIKKFKKFKFCDKIKNITELVKKETSEISAQNFGKISKIFPNEILDKNVIDDVIKYKVMEDSISPTVESLKNEIPEIAQHIQFREYVKSLIDQDKQEEALRKEGLVILKNKIDPFHKYEIDTHHYKKFHDRGYEVDIEDVLTKDLFAKQRVVDEYVEENKKRMNDMVGFYQNQFKFMKFNKYSYLIYQNNYIKHMTKLKLNLLRNISSVSILSSIFYFTNPYLLLVLIPEYVSLVYIFNIMNKLVDQIILHDDKQSVLFRTFNFLGFRKDFPKIKTSILKVFYGDKFKNDVMNLNDKGFFFITRLIRRYFNKNKNAEFDNFKYFHKIRITGKSFYLPADLSAQHIDTNEEIVLNLVNNNVKYVLEFDYSTYEDRAESMIKLYDEYKKEFAKKSHSSYMTQEEILKQEYSSFQPNRDFSDSKYELTLKRTDGLDGTYVNNGYR